MTPVTSYAEIKESAIQPNRLNFQYPAKLVYPLLIHLLLKVHSFKIPVSSTSIYYILFKPVTPTTTLTQRVTAHALIKEW
jgi:hypothetical protein